MVYLLLHSPYPALLYLHTLLPPIETYFEWIVKRRFNKDDEVDFTPIENNEPIMLCELFMSCFYIISTIHS